MTGYARSMTFYWALTGMFAALQFILTVFPFSYAIGAGGFLTLGLISAPLIGFLLGPIYGTFAVIIGAFLGVFANPGAAVLGYFTPIAPATAAVIAGCIRIRKGFIVPIIYIIGIGLFLIGPIGTLAFAFLWLHVIAMLLSLLFVLPLTNKPLIDSLDNPTESNPIMSTITITLIVFIGLLADHIIGSAIGVYYFAALGYDAATLAGWWMAIIFVYPVERILATVIGAAITIAIATALRGTNIELPTTAMMSDTWETLPEE